MTWQWKLFARLFPETYDLLFDVMNDYRLVVDNSEEYLDIPVERWFGMVLQLGYEMGCWSDKPKIKSDKTGGRSDHTVKTS